MPQYFILAHTWWHETHLLKQNLGPYLVIQEAAESSHDVAGTGGDHDYTKDDNVGGEQEVMAQLEVDPNDNQQVYLHLVEADGQVCSTASSRLIS